MLSECCQGIAKKRSLIRASLRLEKRLNFSIIFLGFLKSLSLIDVDNIPYRPALRSATTLDTIDCMARNWGFVMIRPRYVGGSWEINWCFNIKDTGERTRMEG